VGDQSSFRELNHTHIDKGPLRRRAESRMNSRLGISRRIPGCTRYIRGLCPGIDPPITLPASQRSASPQRKAQEHDRIASMRIEKRTDTKETSPALNKWLESKYMCAEDLLDRLVRRSTFASSSEHLAKTCVLAKDFYRGI